MSDEYGLCVVCGGHGGYTVRDDSHRLVTRWQRCRLCDGRDRVTPLVESHVESRVEE